MPRCEILGYAVPEGTGTLGYGAARACYDCKTHGMHDIHPPGPDGLCSVGKIEKNTEAIDAIHDKVAALLEKVEALVAKSQG